MGNKAFRSITRDVLRFLLAGVFLIAGAAKLMDLSGFAQRFGDFGLVYDAAVVPTAWAIVLCEFVTGILLVCWVRFGLACAVALLLMFVSVLSYGIALGFDTDCGCFGPGVHVSLRTQRFIDCGMLVVCAIIYWLAPAERLAAIDVKPPSSKTESS